MAGVRKKLKRRQDALGADYDMALALVTRMYPDGVPLGTEGAHKYPKVVDGPDGIPMAVNKNHADGLRFHLGE